jgi:hypothetical protein
MAFNDWALETLEDARRRGVAWPKILEALKVLEQSSPVDTHGRAWVKVAAEKTKYTTNLIRQAQRTYATLEKLVAENPGLPSDLLSRHTFSHLEIIARIANIAPDSALKYLSMKSLPYRDLRFEYERLKSKQPERLSPGGIGQLVSQALIKQCKATLDKHNNLFDPSGEMHIQKWPEGFALARPPFIGVIEGPDWIEINGFSCCNIQADTNRDAVVRFVTRIATESTFFTTFTVLMPSWAPIPLISQDVQTLDLRNVGLVEIFDDRQPPRILSSPYGLPVPDRRHLLAGDKYFLRRLHRLRG